MNTRLDTAPLTSTLASNHNAMSPVALDFIRFALNYVGTDSPQNIDREGQSLFVQKYPFDLQVIPLVMSKAKSREWGNVAVALSKIYRKLVVTLAKSNPALLNDYFESGSEDTLEYIFNGHTGLEYCLMRGDFTDTADGFKLLEFNVTGNIGGWGIFLFEELYRNNPVVKEFTTSRGIEFSTHAPLNQMAMHIIGVTQAYCQDGRMPTIGVFVEEPGRLEEALDLAARIKQKLLAHAGVKIEFSCFTSTAEFELKDGSIHTANGRIDSLLLFSATRILPDFVKRKNKQNEFPIFDTRAAEILGQKSGLSLLSEYAQWAECSAEERQVIEAHLPWTRLVKAGIVNYEGQQQDLETLLASQKDHFVIKPNDGFQGRGVNVGNRLSQEQWQSVIASALAVPGKYIVQRFCLPLRMLALNNDGQFEEHDAVWGPFVFGEQYAGNSVRLAPSNNDTGVINAHRGAKDTFIFLHD
jgi:hypothetical protein